MILGGFLGLAYCCASAARAQGGSFGTIGEGHPSPPAGGTDDRHRDERPHSSDRHRHDKGHFQGCHLTRAGISAARDGSYGLLDTSGIPLIDQVFAREINGFMIPLFRHSPACCFYRDDDSPNAFATPERLRGDGQGTVGFGVALMRSLLTKFSRGAWSSTGDHAAVAIFAHEFGHIVQFFNGFPMVRGKLPELHADYMAGWYTGTRALQLYGYQQVDFGVISRQMYDIGDFEFTDPGHHGTPQERVQTYLSGVSLAVQTHGRAGVQDAFVLGRQLLGV